MGLSGNELQFCSLGRWVVADCEGFPRRDLAAVRVGSHLRPGGRTETKPTVRNTEERALCIKFFFQEDSR